MEEALQSNETIDIYQNEFELFNANGEISQETTNLSSTIKDSKSYYSVNC